MASNTSKKTYTIHITYTSNSPTSDFDRQKDNTNYNSSGIGMSGYSSKPYSNYQSKTGKISIAYVK